MAEYPNVFQPTFEELKSGYKMKGQWKKDFFKNDNPLVVELGCGKGEYAVGLAQKYPNKNFLGVDVKGARMWKGSTDAIEGGAGDDNLFGIGGDDALPQQRTRRGRGRRRRRAAAWVRAMLGQAGLRPARRLVQDPWHRPPGADGKARRSHPAVLKQWRKRRHGHGVRRLGGGRHDSDSGGADHHPVVRAGQD